MHVHKNHWKHRFDLFCSGCGIFESRGIVGERLWDLEGGAYLDYCNRVKPILNKRIAWYKKKQVEKLGKSL